MTTRFEIFAVGAAAPADVWALVGDPHRLPEWTDVDGVTVEPSGPDTAGPETFTTRDGARTLTWRVVTREQRLLEAVTTLPDGELGVGVRVARDPAGSRVILAAAFEPRGRVAAVRFLLVGAPALRRRFDRWSRAAAGPRPAAA